MNDLSSHREVALMFSHPDCNDVELGSLVISEEGIKSEGVAPHRVVVSDIVLEFSAKGILANGHISITWVMWDEIVRRVEKGRPSL